MTITIRPLSTIEFIGLSETNTIGYKDGLALRYHGLFSTQWTRKRCNVASIFTSIDELQTAIN